MALSKEEIFGLCDRKPTVEVVNVPDAGEFRIRVMGGADRDSFEASNYTTDDKGKLKPDLRNVRARLLARCLCNEAGDRLFTDADAPKLGKMAALLAVPIYEACRKLNRMDADDVDEAEKNSPAANADSGSDSPPTSA